LRWTDLSAVANKQEFAVVEESNTSLEVACDEEKAGMQMEAPQSGHWEKPQVPASAAWPCATVLVGEYYRKSHTTRFRSAPVFSISSLMTTCSRQSAGEGLIR